MADRGWIEPAGGPEQWRKLNKYKDGRRVAYICTYVDLLDNDDYLALPEPTALLLHRLWIAFATHRGHLANDTRTLSQRCGQRVTKPMLQLLVNAGFIRISVTKPSRTRYGFGTSRSRELEVEGSPISPNNETPTNPRAQGTNPRAQGTNPRADPTPTKSVRAIRAIINGHSWDPETTDAQSMADEFRRTTQRVDHQDLNASLEEQLLNEWEHERRQRLETTG